MVMVMTSFFILVMVMMMMPMMIPLIYTRRGTLFIDSGGTRGKRRRVKDALTVFEFPSPVGWCAAAGAVLITS
jgi:hypothetical protein